MGRRRKPASTCARSSANRSRPEVFLKQISEQPAMAARQPGSPHRHNKAMKNRRDRAFVLGPVVPCLVFCVIFGAFFQAPGAGSAGAVFVAVAMGASAAWIVAAGLALALDRAIRRTSFMRRDQASGDDAGKDWDTRTGSFAWMEDWEDFQYDDDHHRH